MEAKEQDYDIGSLDRCEDCGGIKTTDENYFILHGDCPRYNFYCYCGAINEINF